MASAPPVSKPAPYRRKRFGLRRVLSLMGMGGAPTYVIVILGLLFLGTIAGGAAFAIRKYTQKTTNESRAVLWQAFEAAAKLGDEEGMKTALDEIIAAHPKETVAINRKKAFETGEASADDEFMPILTMNIHARANRWPEADREANKRLTHQPEDWGARCITAHAALAKNDVEAAKAALAKLPDLNERSPISPNGLLYAVQLFNAVKKDVKPLQEFARRVMPDAVKNPKINSYPTGMRISVLKCYLFAFDYNAKPGEMQPPRLNSSITRVMEICRDTLKSATELKEYGTLTALGEAMNQLRQAFSLFVRDKTIQLDQYTALCNEIDELSMAIWPKLIELEPKNVIGYRGLALYYNYVGKITESLQTAMKGLEINSEDPLLLYIFSSQIQQYTENVRDTLPLMQAAAKRKPENLFLWMLLFDHAMAARDLDVAKEAIAKAEKIQPNDKLIVFGRARLLIENNDPLGAIQAIDKLDESTRNSDPNYARLYAQACVQSGLTIKLKEYLQRVEERAQKLNQPQLVEATLTGIVSSQRFHPEAMLAASKLALVMLERYRENVNLMRLSALAQYRIIDESEIRWEKSTNRTAMNAYNRLRAFVPSDLDASARIAWIYLKGERDKEQALREVKALRDADKNKQKLTGFQYLVMGSACVANNLNEPAIQYLEKAKAVGLNNASVNAHLALAYFQSGDRVKYRTFIDLARQQPNRSEQEQSDYKEIVLQLPL